MSVGVDVKIDWLCHLRTGMSFPYFHVSRGGSQYSMAMSLQHSHVTTAEACHFGICMSVGVHVKIELVCHFRIGMSFGHFHVSRGACHYSIRMSK